MEGLQSFDNGKTGLFNATGNGTILTSRSFPLDEATQVIEMAPVLGGRNVTSVPAVGQFVRDVAACVR
jgi:hypothetical protein